MTEIFRFYFLLCELFTMTEISILQLETPKMRPCAYTFPLK